LSQKHVFTEEETARGVQASKTSRSSKAERRLLREIQGSELLLGLTGEVKEVVMELIRAANSNPIIGVFVTIASADVMHRAKVLSDEGYIAVLAFLGLIEGGQVAANVLDAAGNLVGSLIPSIAGQKAAIDNLVNPSATTLVFENTSKASLSGEQGALMSLLASRRQVASK